MRISPPSPSTLNLAQLKSGAGANGLQKLCLGRLFARIAGPQELVEARPGGRQTLLVSAGQGNSNDGKWRVKVREATKRRSFRGSDKAHKLPALLVIELHQNLPEPAYGLVRPAIALPVATMLPKVLHVPAAAD